MRSGEATNPGNPTACPPNGALHAIRKSKRKTKTSLLPALGLFLCGIAIRSSAQAQAQSVPSSHPLVLHAARLLDIESGTILTPGEILVQGERIVEVGSTIRSPCTSISPGVRIFPLSMSSKRAGRTD